QYAIGDDRPARRIEPLFGLSEFLVPQFFSGFHVERHDVIVDGHAKDLAVINRRSAAVERGASDSRLYLNRRPPDLLPGFDVDGKSPFSVDHIHHAVIDRWLRQLTLVVHDARAPDGHEAFHIAFID